VLCGIEQVKGIPPIGHMDSHQTSTKAGENGRLGLEYLDKKIPSVLSHKKTWLTLGLAGYIINRRSHKFYSCYHLVLYAPYGLNVLYVRYPQVRQESMTLYVQAVA